MSQPLNFGPNEKDPLDILLTNEEQLVQVFHSYEVPSDAVLMGIEYEIFGYDRMRRTPLSYEGQTSITSLFFHLVKISEGQKDPWVALMEETNIVAVTNQFATIALEPGGQIEIAAKPHNNLSHMNAIFKQVLEELNQAALDLEIDLFAIGIHPLARREDMAQVKKSRYEIMRRYMQGRLGLGMDMMTRTCSIQLNLDFTSEADMVEKTRLAAYTVPIFSLLCSSSAFLEGRPAKHALERGYIWQQTDHDRTGIPAIIFDDNFGYASWISWALNVPMYFIRRENKYIDVAGASFRDFMTKGLKNQRATIRDFMDHLSTIFTEIRLKPFLELRSADSLPGVYVYALSALAWGLFYNQESRTRALALFNGVSHAELVDFHDQVIKSGREAQLRGRKILDIAGDLLTLSSLGLLPEQKTYLKAFENIIQKDSTCAELLKDTFSSMNTDKLAALVHQMGPLVEPLI